MVFPYNAHCLYRLSSSFIKGQQAALMVFEYIEAWYNRNDYILPWDTRHLISTERH